LFVTMTTGFVRVDPQRLVLLSAGDPRPILLGDHAANTIAFDGCPPLGLFTKDLLGDPTTVELTDVWTLIMFTDGLFEGYASAGASERLGCDGIERWCSEIDGASVGTTTSMRATVLVPRGEARAPLVSRTAPQQVRPARAHAGQRPRPPIPSAITAP
jgi:hypothetical protein